MRERPSLRRVLSNPKEEGAQIVRVNPISRKIRHHCHARITTPKTSKTASPKSGFRLMTFSGLVLRRSARVFFSPHRFRPTAGIRDVFYSPDQAACTHSRQSASSSVIRRPDPVLLRLIHASSFRRISRPYDARQTFPLRHGFSDFYAKTPSYSTAKASVFAHIQGSD